MMKRKIIIYITLLTILVTLASCGKGTTTPNSETILNATDNTNSGESYDVLSTDTPDDATPETTDIREGTAIDFLWYQLKGTWEFEEYTYMGKVTHYGDGDHTMEFIYIDEVPCMRRYTERDDGYFPDKIFYEADIIDEFHYNAYTYKRGSYGGEGENWSDDTRLVWWSFDLSNLSNGELLMTYNIARDSGSIDDANAFRYICNTTQ